MKDSYNLIDFIKMYYLDSNIPMYLFSDNNACSAYLSRLT